VPADAEVEVEGEKTKMTGGERSFESPPLEPGKKYLYTIKITWRDDGKVKTYTEKVAVQPGDEKTIDFRLKTPDVVYVPTPDKVVEKMLDMAKVTKDDVLFDLGCGDGRIVITAAKKYGIKGVGIDINPDRINESRENAKKAGVENLVEFRLGDIFKNIEDLNKATVVTLYLLPELNLRLRPVLQKTLKPGSRIVTHNYHMGDWKSDQRATLKADDGDEHYVYLFKLGDGKKDDKKDDKKDEKPKKDEVKKDEVKKDDKPKKEEK
jgi:uncharacterized protein (TIGR03000 family)